MVFNEGIKYKITKVPQDKRNEGTENNFIQW